MKIGNGNIPLRIGNLIDTVVHGGPYARIPDDMFGVKMAAEISGAYNVSIPTEDFSVPEVSDLRVGVVKALMGMINGEEVYAGCVGGLGRTGIFLAALAKVQSEYRKSKHRVGGGEDPVLYVRKHFTPLAIETAGQEEFIAAFDVSSIVEWLDVTQTAMGLGGLTTPRVGETVQGQISQVLDGYKDWLDDPEPDSAGIITSDEDMNSALFMSLQTQIDELREDVNTLARAGEYTLEGVEAGFEAHKKLIFVLTKPTLSERIRTWWKAH